MNIINIDINKILKYPKKYNNYNYQYNCLKDIDKLLYNILNIIPDNINKEQEIKQFIYYFKNKEQIYDNKNYEMYVNYFESTYSKILMLYEPLKDLYNKISIYNQAAKIGNNIVKFIHNINNNNHLISNIQKSYNKLLNSNNINNSPIINPKILQTKINKAQYLMQQNNNYADYINSYGINIINFINNAKNYNNNCKTLEYNIIQYIQQNFQWIKIE